MCIYNVKKVKVKEPITVYKVLRYRPMCGFLTPFRDYLVDKDIIAGKVPLEAERPNFTPYRPEYGIDVGYIHAYADLTDAVNEYYDYYTRTGSGIATIFECRIDPSDDDNYCWVGDFDSYPYNKTYAARRMTFVRQLQRDEVRAIRYKYLEENPASNKKPK